MSRLHDVAVVGGGSAGTMAYLRAVLNYDDTVWFTGDSKTRKRGRGTWVSAVDNIPGFHGDIRPIASAATSTQKWIEAHPHLSQKSTVVRSMVTSISLSDEGAFELVSEAKGKEERHLARFVIVATGIMDVQPKIRGSIEPVFPYANRGDLIYCVRCDGHHVLGKTVAIIGPPPTSIAIAYMMHERYGVEGIHVLTHGSPEPTGDDGKRLPHRYGVRVHTSPIDEILGDPKEAGLTGFRLEDGSEVAAEKAIVAMGIIVYNQLLSGLGAELAPDGRVLTRDNGETSIQGIFAAGDLVAGKKMQIYTGWDEAVDAADEINRRLRAKRRAERGHS